MNECMYIYIHSWSTRTRTRVVTGETYPIVIGSTFNICDLQLRITSEKILSIYIVFSLDTTLWFITQTYVESIVDQYHYIPVKHSLNSESSYNWTSLPLSRLVHWLPDLHRNASAPIYKCIYSMGTACIHLSVHFTSHLAFRINLYPTK